MAGIRIGQAAGGDSRAFPEKRVICKGFAGTGITGGYPGSGSRVVFGLWGQLKFPFSGHEKYFYLASHSGNCFLSDESFY